MTLMMSVSGVRGIVGETMTPTLACELGAAYGTYLGGGTVVIGRDSRRSGEMVRSAVTSGLLATGCSVVELGIVTTPGTAMMTIDRGAAGGIVLTASHNPSQWNGIKFLTAQGFAPPPETAERIFQIYRDKAFNLVDWPRTGTIEHDATTHEKHVAKVMEIIDVPAIKQRQFKVVLDSVNGAGGVGGRRLLEALGCTIVHINGEPTGDFAHTPEPTEANLTGLCEAVKQQHADVGFAQDPDADRLAVVDNTGRYIGEEYTLALSAKQVLAKNPGPVAANLSTSRMIDDIAQQAGGHPVLRTAVGEANVAGAVLGEPCVLGGEGNGGVIDPRVVPVRDSFVAMGLVLNLLVDEGRPLSAIVEDMPRYCMVKEKFEVDREGLPAWFEKVRNGLDGRVNDADGLRIDRPEGWVHVRPSNTEPIARVISEAGDRETAEALARRVSELR